jgi:hypothetical protein
VKLWTYSRCSEQSENLRVKSFSLSYFRAAAGTRVLQHLNVLNSLKHEFHLHDI